MDFEFWAGFVPDPLEAGERTVVVSEAKGSKESRSNNDHRLGLTSGFAPFHFLLRFTDFIVVDGNDGPM